MMFKTTTLTLLGIFTIFVLTAEDTHAQGEITQAQILDEAELYTQEIERIRLYLGIRPPRSRKFVMENAQPRHVYFQTQIAFRKSNQLAQQLTGVSRVAAPIAPEGDPSIAELSAIINAARAQLDVIEEALETTRPLPDLPKIRVPGMSGAMMRMVESNLILDELTGYRADWADIWDRLFQIITYLGGALPEENRYPPLEDHVPSKTVGDVAAHLLAIREAVAPASKSVGMTQVRTTITKPAEGGSSAEGISDLTATFVNEFAEMTFRLEAEDVDPPAYQRPSRVFPSHAYQLAQALRKQAEVLGEMYE